MNKIYNTFVDVSFTVQQDIEAASEEEAQAKAEEFVIDKYGEKQSIMQDKPRHLQMETYVDEYEEED